MQTFRSFLQGGFECSTHRRANGRKRLDLIAATQHDQLAEYDYRLLAAQRIFTCRDGMRWHAIERAPGEYDFSSLRSMLRAARKVGMEVIWDVCHYGWPDDLDIFSPKFIDRFARFAAAAARVVAQETDGTPWFSLINEPSFFSWAAAEVGLIGPFENNRGTELKKQLIQSAIGGLCAVRDEAPNARFVQVDPLIHIVPAEGASRAEAAEAAAYCRAQFQAWDMLTGRLCPELGGRPEYLDVIGCNYYIHNQWVYGGQFIEPADPRYRPLRHLLMDVHRRYGRPVFLAETGIEGEQRPEWFRYSVDEVIAAREMGVPVEGICLYPIVNHPGWEDDRHCHNGLWDYCNNSGRRKIYRPLADELRRQQARIEAALSRAEDDELSFRSFA